MTMKNITLPVTGMTCASCANRIERGLKKVGGVETAQVLGRLFRSVMVTLPGRRAGARRRLSDEGDIGSVHRAHFTVRTCDRRGVVGCGVRSNRRCGGDRDADDR